MADTASPNPLLVDALWRLKREWERVFGGELTLGKLINDPDYLQATLRQALGSKDAELTSAARRAQILKQAEWMESTKQKETVVPAATVEESPTPALYERRGFSMAAGIVIAIALVGAAGSLIRNTSESRDPGTTAAKRQAPAPVAAAAVTGGEPEIALRIHGSNTVGEKLTPKLVEALLAAKGGRDIRVVPGKVAEEKTVVATLPGYDRPIAVEIHAHGSSTAFKDLLSGVTDIGQSSRPIKADEAVALRDRHGDLTSAAAEHVLALDGLAILVHPGNKVTSLTVDQVAQLFAGKITDWSGVGGAPGPVRLHARDDKSGTYDTFKSLVLEPHKLSIAAWAQRYESSGELSDAVAGDPQAIGFAGIAYVKSSKLVAIAATAGTPAILPSRFTLATEDYPLARRLYLYTPPQLENPLARDLVDLALSPQGQDIVKDVGFISQTLFASREPAGNDAPSDYREIAQKAERLSVNFRFRPGEEVLDSKAMRDLDRLTRFLGDNPDRDVLLLGFTDSQGDARRNLELSQRRAQVIEGELRTRGVRPESVLGFGESIALASNDTDLGRQRNRRVEVWVR